MIFLQLKDRVLGYFDNFRTDAYFRGVKISDITVSRMNSWSNRNFCIANLETITKAQTKALNYTRLKRVMNNESQWKHVAAKLSKGQILELKYDESKMASFSVNKIYKLFSTGQISERFAYDHLLTVLKDNPQRRSEIITKGFEFGFFSKEISSLDYLNLIMNQPLERILPYLSTMKMEHISPEIANLFISKLNLHTLSRLYLIDNTMIEKIWELSTTKLTDPQKEDIRSFIKSSLSYGDFNFLNYLPLNEGFFDTEVIETLRRNLHQNKPQAIQILSTLTTSKINYLWDYLAKEIAPHITHPQFVKLGENNAFGLCDLLGPKYYLFLNECSPQEFQSIWNHCPQLHSAIIKNCVFVPDLVLNNIDPKNLYLLAFKHPDLFQKYPEKFLDDYLFKLIDTYKGRLSELNLTCAQVLHYLKSSSNQATKESIFYSFYDKYKSDLINFDEKLTYINNIPEVGLDGLIAIDGIRERLANNWDGENQAHIYLGSLFNFSPKDYPSSKWFLYCDKMSNKQFDVWIKTGPKMTHDHFIHAFSRLQHLERKTTFMLRGRDLWDLEPDMLVKHTDANTKMFFPYVFPLKNWTPEIYQDFKHSLFYNIYFSIKHKLDKSETILEASKFYKEGIIALLTRLSKTDLQKTKRFVTCLTEWNKRAIDDFKKQLQSPETNLKSLILEIDNLVHSNFITQESRQQMQLILDAKNAEQIKRILENPDYVSLKEELAADVKIIEETDDSRKIILALDSFAIKYTKLKEIIKDIKIVDMDLESMKKIINEKQVEMDSEEGIFEFFAPLHTENVKKGITPEVIEKNRAILQRAYERGYTEIGEVEKKQVSDGLLSGSAIVRDEIGKVDLAYSLKRIGLAFPKN